jgi:hypothetical protein
MDAGQSIAARFTWHPEYAGRLLVDVRQELVQNISSDQRGLALALEAAESREDDALESVLRLERKWSEFDLNWAEADPGELADRILQWEWEREKRQELFPYAEMREQIPAPSVPQSRPTGFIGWLRSLFGGGDS